MTGQEAHPDGQTVAEFRAGLVDGQRAAWLADHLARCARCGQSSARLDEVSTMLAAAPRPSMPPDVTRRLMSALAAEAAARGTGPVTEGVRAPARSRSARRPAGRRRLAVPSVLIPVAIAACLLLAGGGLLLGGLGGSPHGVSAANNDGGSSASRTNGESPLNRGTGAGFRVLASGTDYEPATLGAQVSSRISAAGGAPTFGSSGVSSPGTAHPEAGLATAAERNCVYAVTSGSQPVLVDSARYGGKPAVVIATSSSAWVVSPACDTSQPHVIAHVRLAAG